MVGRRTYPVSYTYDSQGRMKTMTTWTNATAGTGGATTTWNYDPYRGFLQSKVYQGGTGTILYSNTPAGRLARIDWARGVFNLYSYDNGDLTGVSYSDSTPGVTFEYDTRGRMKTATQGGVATSLTYNDAGQMRSETRNGVTVSNSYDSLLRRSGADVYGSGLSAPHQTFSYTTASRLDTITTGSSAVSYDYLANSPLARQITFKSSGTTRLTTTKAYDYLNRLLDIQSAPVTNALADYAYQHNPANQRTRTTEADGSYWTYDYDGLGQVKSAKKRWSDGTLVAGQQFEYAFDDIGNRTQTKSGGDSSGAGMRVASYTPDLLNRYTQREVPGSADVIGSANAAVAVSVNGQTADRKGPYFRKEVSAANTSTPALLAVTITASNATTTGSVYFAKTAELFNYDADGNLTGDGRWTNRWDGQNRLINQETIASAVSAGLTAQSLVHGYDYMDRRISKVVSNKVSGTWTKISEQRFVYDGWNLVAVLDDANQLLQSFVWGKDLSGGMRGAGGVGGLLSITLHTGSYVGTYYYVNDGNGNIIGLVDGNGMWVARYEYAAFGELLRATGPLAFINPFRFSSKYQDDETGFVYYGYRFYNASMGRWLSRDPIGERGGINIYRFVDNDGINAFDSDGLEKGGASGLMNNPNPAFPGLALTPLNVIRFMGGLPFSIASGDFFTSKVQPTPFGNGRCTALVTVNGMMNTRSMAKDFLDWARQGSFSGNDYNLQAFNTTTWIGDPFQILGDELWMIQSASAALASQLNQLRKQFRANGCCRGSITVVAHSQGTKVYQRAVSMLDPETRRMISYYGISGEAQIVDGDAGQVQNFTNLGDLVPYLPLLNPLNWVDWCVMGAPNVSSIDGPLFGHGRRWAFNPNSVILPPLMAPTGR